MCESAESRIITDDAGFADKRKGSLLKFASTSQSD